MREVEYETMSFIKEKYQSSQELWKDIGCFIEILLKNNKVCKVIDNDVVIIIEYEHDETICAYGGPHLAWVTAEELDSLYYDRTE